ncbi:MAG: MmgE/PrpD family protein [Deltaproteobacteria bacterium]|nr:MmgE/PrpD family protein [Deltaproteobacteria bacterium]
MPSKVIEQHEGVTRKLAYFAAGLRYEDIPVEVIEKAKDCILYLVGCELIGSTTQAIIVKS